MNVKIADLMVANVLTVQPHHSVEHIRGILKKNRLNTLPVVDSDGGVVGIVSSADLVGGLKSGTPISKIMTTRVYSVPQYDDVHIAARVMRNHKIHHVVVTHEQKVVGILSSFDLIKLVEDHRFIMKGAPTESTRKGSKRS